VKVIFFDIDETMIHCLDDRDPPDMRGEVSLVVRLEEHTTNSSEGSQPHSIQIQINIRPGLRECLLDLSKSFQLISFTASDQSYADTILDYIDPTHEIFMARLYR
jgi:CTD small phosphatase-like protein 2